MISAGGRATPGNVDDRRGARPLAPIFRGPDQPPARVPATNGEVVDQAAVGDVPGCRRAAPPTGGSSRARAVVVVECGRIFGPVRPVRRPHRRGVRRPHRRGARRPPARSAPVPAGAWDAVRSGVQADLEDPDRATGQDDRLDPEDVRHVLAATSWPPRPGRHVLAATSWPPPPCSTTRCAARRHSAPGRGARQRRRADPDARLPRPSGAGLTRPDQADTVRP